MLKGQTQNLAHMILLIMVGAVLAGSVGGSLYGAMEDGYNQVQQFLGMSDRVELSDAGDVNATRDLVGITHYTWDRAHGCEQVDSTIGSGGYSNLADTSYGEEPPCSGQGGSVIASISNIWGNTGNDMEGRVSRIEFEVKDRIVLNTSRTYGEEGWEGNQKTWNGETEPFRPWALSTNKSSYQERVVQECRIPSEVGMASTDIANAWPIIYTEDVPEDRIRRNRDALNWTDAQNLDFENIKISLTGVEFDFGPTNHPLCAQKTTTSATEYVQNTGFLSHEDMVERWDGERGSTKAVLCPGDEGYVQVNKGYAHNSAEFTGYPAGDYMAEYIQDYGGSNINTITNAIPFLSVDTPGMASFYKKLASDEPSYFPHIQITNVNESANCELESPEIPGDANSKGSDLQVKADLEGNTIDVREFRMRKEGRDQCRVNVIEKDPAASEEGYVDYRPGSILEKKDTFPDTESSQVRTASLTYRDEGGWIGNAVDTVTLQDGKSGDLYNFLENTGLNGDPVDSDNAPLLSTVNGQSLEMYGDLLCVNNLEEMSNPQWIACDQSVEEFEEGEDNVVEVNPSMASGTGTVEYRCNLRSGDWEKVREEGKTQDEEDKPNQCQTDSDCSSDRVCGQEGICKTPDLCQAVTKEGATDEKVDIVFIGDGYQGNELEQNVRELVDREGDSEGLLAKEPFQGNESLFNTWMVETDQNLPIRYRNPYRINVTSDEYQDFSAVANFASEDAISIEVTMTEDRSALTSSAEMQGLYSSGTMDQNTHEMTLEVNSSTINNQGVRQRIEDIDVSLEKLTYQGMVTVQETDTGSEGSVRVTSNTAENYMIAQLEEPAIAEMKNRCQSKDVDEVVVLSDRQGRSYADTETSPKSNTDDTKAVIFLGNARDRTALFSHEFGHSFAGLADEYVEPSLGDNPAQPNCADTQQQAENWWGEIAENNESVDYFNGCSYVENNYRPMENSIMRYHTESGDFGPVNERRIADIIDAYKQGELQ